MSSYLEKSVETFIDQQEVVHAQLARMMSTEPLGAMSEMTRQNSELSSRMQASMLETFTTDKEKGKTE